MHLHPALLDALAHQRESELRRARLRATRLLATPSSADGTLRAPSSFFRRRARIAIPRLDR